jgi:hypothetical protein
VKAGVPEGKVPGCTETKANDGSKATADAGNSKDSQSAGATKADAAKPKAKSKYARSHPRRSWFGRADLLTLLGRR